MTVSLMVQCGAAQTAGDVNDKATGTALQIARTAAQADTAEAVCQRTGGNLQYRPCDGDVGVPPFQCKNGIDMRTAPAQLPDGKLCAVNDRNPFGYCWAFDWTPNCTGNNLASVTE